MRQKNPQDLDSRLNAYSETVQTDAGSRSVSERLSRWPMYAAATGSALALGTSAAASIIYFSGPSVTATAPIGPAFASDYKPFLNAPYGAASVFAAAMNVAAYQRAIVGISNCGCYPTPFFVQANTSGFLPIQPLKKFAFGQMISSGLLGGPNGTTLALNGFMAAKCEAGTTACVTSSGSPIAYSYNAQPWGPSNATGFAGFVTYGGNFGWVRLRWFADSGFPASVEAIDWAIEMTGAPIMAGDTVGVPEPGTMSMALLAAGSAGIAAWRKRKNAAAKTAA